MSVTGEAGVVQETDRGEIDAVMKDASLNVDFIRDIIDLEAFPLDRPGCAEYRELVVRCRGELEQKGMFNLDGFVRPEAIARAAAQLAPLAGQAFTHTRRHNVYFNKQDAVPATHGALKTFQTTHHTLCDDQLAGTIVRAIYEWQPLPTFLAQVFELPELYVMDDPLARANVIEYRDGECLNWHFDRSVFTVTLLIQSPEQGGAFEYRSALRTDFEPNFEGVANVLRGNDTAVQVNPLAAGTLNVFQGKNTLHRVSTVIGDRSRLIAVYSYYERPHVTFSEAERIGFYGRAEALTA